MANFIPSKHEANEYNNGNQYVNEDKVLGIEGDGLQAETINNLVESALYSQEKAEEAVEKASLFDPNGTYLGMSVKAAYYATADAEGTQFAGNYAKVNGNYPDMTVGNANNAQVANAALEAQRADTAISDDSGNRIQDTYAKKDGRYQTMHVGSADEATIAYTDENGDRFIDNYLTKGNYAYTLDTVYLKKTDILNAIFPVGSYYLSNEATSPAELFGGSWTAISSKFLYLAAQTLGTKTGGSSSHTLTINEMPNHDHQQRVAITGTGGAYAYTNFINQVNYTDQTNGSIVPQPSYPTTGSTGGGQAFEILPPYRACYGWRRTS